MSIDHLLADSWRREEIARSKPYEPPESAIDDYAGDCVCLRINTLWIPFITGVVDLLRNPNLWIHADSDYAPNEITKLILALMGSNPDMSCSEFITGITFEGGVLKFTQNGEEFEVSGTETIVTGVSSDGTNMSFEQGGAPVSLECCSYPDKPDYDADKVGNLRSCAIATNLVEWIMEKYQDSLDAAEAAADTVSAADSIIAIFTGVGYLFFDALTDAVNEWFEATINVARALDTVGLRDDMKEFLYCKLIDNDNTMTDAIWDDFKAEFAIIGDSIWLYLGAFKYDAIEQEARRASYGQESGCELYPCADCINKFFDFEEAGFYTISQGFEEADVPIHLNVVRDNEDGTSAHEAIVEIGFSLAATETVSQVRFQWYAESALGTEDTNRDVQVWVDTNDGVGGGWVNRVSNLNHNQKEQTWATITVELPSPIACQLVRVKWRTGWGASDNAGAFIRIDGVCIT